MSERPEYGVYLREAEPLVRAIKHLMVESSELLDPEIALPRRDRVTVYVTNHGPVWTPFPAPVLTVEYLLAQGGYNDLVAITLFHRVVEITPGLSPLLKRYFGHATPQMRSLSGIIDLMRSRKVQIFGTAPEGRSCIYSFDEPVGPFTKNGLMVAALEADADLVIAAQKGVEKFGVHVRLPFGARLPLPRRPRGLQLPTWHYGRRAHITVGYRRYQPRLTAAERAALDPTARRAQLGEELAAIHREMTDLYLSLP